MNQETIARQSANALRLVPIVMVLLVALVAVRAGVSDALSIPGDAPRGAADSPTGQPGSEIGTGSQPTGTGSSTGTAGSGTDPSLPPATGTAPVGDPGSSSPPAERNPDGPSEVAVVDPLLDALGTGFTAGPGTFLGIINGLISVAVGPLTELPGGTEVAVLLSEVLSDLQAPTAEFQAVMLDTIESLRSVLSGLSVANPALNQALEQSASNLEAIALQYGPHIQPFDGTLIFFAGVLRDQMRD